MEGVKGSTRKKLIGSFYAKNWQHGKLFTVKYFQEMDVPPKTTYRILKECDEGRPMQRKPGSGRPAHKMKQNKVRALIRYLEGKVGVSQRKAAKKFGVSQSYVAKIVREKSSMRYFRRQPVPAATEQQKKKQKQRCSELRRHLFKPRGKTLIIMDDESYFRLKGDQMGSQQRLLHRGQRKHKSRRKIPHCGQVSEESHALGGNFWEGCQSAIFHAENQSKWQNLSGRVYSTAEEVYRRKAQAMQSGSLAGPRACALWQICAGGAQESENSLCSKGE